MEQKEKIMNQNKLIEIAIKQLINKNKVLNGIAKRVFGKKHAIKLTKKVLNNKSVKREELNELAMMYFLGLQSTF
jgi:hypothetical protein